MTLYTENRAKKAKALCSFACLFAKKMLYLITNINKTKSKCKK